MRFSIVIPVLNEAETLPLMLQNLQSLRLEAEIIVVDGGSSDNTVAVARAYADNVIESPRGRALQMNAGARIAQGEWLVFLHADTNLPGNALKFIDEGFRAGNCWGRFDVVLSGKPVMLKVIAAMMNWRSRLTGIATGDQVIFVLREVFWQVGGYPEIALMEDIALSKRLNRVSAPVCFCAKAVSSGRRWETFGVWKTIFLMWSLRLAYFLGVDPAILARCYREGRLWKP